MNKKKGLLSIVLMCVMAFCCVLLTGCGKNPADIEILTGTPVVEVNEFDTQPNWYAVRAKITFEDGTQETVTGVDMVFSHVDVSTPGKKSVSVGYKQGNFRKTIDVLVVDSTTISAAVSGYTGIYDGAEHDAVSITGLSSDDKALFSTNGGTTWNEICPKVKDAGSTTLMVKIEREKYGVLIDTKLVNANTSIEKKLVEIRGKRSTITFGDDIPTNFGYDIIGLEAGETASVLTTQPQINVQYADSDKTGGKLNAGRYAIKLNGAEAANYKFSYVDGSLEVEKATLDMSNIRWSETNIEYEEGVQKEVHLEGLPQDCSATYVGNAATEIGNYTATATLVYDKNNYNEPTLPSGFSLSHNWAIAENVSYTKVSMPTEDTTTFVYNGQKQTYMPQNFDSNSMIISGNAHKNADDYNVTVSLRDGYAWEGAEKGQGRRDLTFVFVIQKRVIEIAWGTTTLFYTGDAQKPSCTVSNLCEGDECVLTISGEVTDANAQKDGTLFDSDVRYTATVVSAGNSNYTLPEDTLATQFDILQAENNWTIVPSVEIFIEGSTPIARHYGGAKFGFENVKYFYKLATEEDSSYTETVPSVDGEYMMKAVIEGTNNFTGLTYVCKVYVDNQNIESIDSNILTERKSKLNGPTDNFTNKNRPLFAGQQNYFDFQLVGNVAKVDGNYSEIIQFATTIKSFIKNGEDYVELNAETFETYISELDSFNNRVTFTTQAIGKTFKFDITREGVAQGVSIEVSVVEGYNVYDADDLSVVNNAKVEGTNTEVRGWAAKKQGTKYENLSTNAIILQKDIIVRDENLPAETFYNAAEAAAVPSGLTNLEIVGSMKDGDGNGTGGNGRAVYDRIIDADGSFSIYGNYWTIDYSAVSRCVVESGHGKGVKYAEDNVSGDSPITTHVTMFFFSSPEGTKEATITEGGNLNIVDLNIIGNGKRDNRSLNSGSTMIAKVSHVNSNIENSKFSNCFIGFLFQDYGSDNETPSQTTNIMRDVKGYDSYNTLLYVWGARDLQIYNSEFVSAGGPVMIVDQVGGDKDTGAGGRPSNVNVIGGKMESFVTGSEPWFVSYGAQAIAGSLKAPNNEFFVPYGSTYLKKGDSGEELLNLKVVYKSSEAEGVTPRPVQGSVCFYDSEEEYEQNQVEGATKSSYALDMTSYSIAAKTSGKELFQNSRNGQILGMSGHTEYFKRAASGTTNVNLYLSMGMGVVLELYPTAA